MFAAGEASEDALRYTQRIYHPAPCGPGFLLPTQVQVEKPRPGASGAVGRYGDKAASVTLWLPEWARSTYLDRARSGRRVDGGMKIV